MLQLCFRAVNHFHVNIALQVCKETPEQVKTFGFQRTRAGTVDLSPLKRSKNISDNLAARLGFPNFADVVYFGKRVLTFHASRIEKQGLVLVLVHVLFQFVHKPVPFPWIELAAEHGILDSFAPTMQKFENAGSPLVVGDVI